MGEPKSWHFDLISLSWLLLQMMGLSALASDLRSLILIIWGSMVIEFWKCEDFFILRLFFDALLDLTLMLFLEAAWLRLIEI